MSVTALIVNFNSGPWLSKCVQALLDNGVHDIRVADNNSSDDSFSLLQGRYGHHSGVRLLANPGNLGFGKAVNALLSNVHSDFVLIINPDCILKPGALKAMLDALEKHPGAALAGPRVLDGRGHWEAAANRRFPRPRNAFMSATGLARWSGRAPALAGIPFAGSAGLTETIATEAVSGACMLVRRQPMQDLGGFDERYQLHCEDLDLMMRFHNAGFDVLFVPQAEATHEQGVSSASRPLWVHREKHRSLRRFYDQHLAANNQWWVRVLMRLGIRLRYLILLPLLWLKR